MYNDKNNCIVKVHLKQLMKVELSAFGQIIKHFSQTSAKCMV